MCSMLLKVYCSSFSAVATCTFNWSMVDLLPNKNESLDGTTINKKKGKHGKYNVQVHSGKYST